MKKLPWGHRPEILDIVNSRIPNKEKSARIYDMIKDFEARANDSFSKPMPCTVEDIMAYLIEGDENEAIHRR